ncbi:aerobic glycerol-3-phosphate dehydrogenase [Bacillus carboniphilus]|uniref:Glycerol-3-phosphate dehydrogenase n=1 Tax=Bacillus carboniphilus TaxID=86663 RepID=A0ABN0W195_9BACI
MFSSLKRNQYIEKLKNNTYDLVVIGGGITGAGIALDAATRGLKVALIEMQDFAAGTSSRSTKLVHGGLRYLKQLEVKMVAEVGKERAIVYENGPHVTTPERMLLPIHQGGTFGKWTTSLGLLVYDYLANVKQAERRKMLDREETLRKEPLIKEDGLKGGGYYVEYRTDDARLTIEVLKAAVSYGAHALNYMKAEGFLYENNKVTGVQATDIISGDRFEIRSRITVNAAGPWVDQVRSLDTSLRKKQLRLTKGVHIVIDQTNFPLKQAIYFDTPDGRMIFAIPRDGKTYVGTTDTFYKEDPKSPRITKEDKAYLLNAIKFMFPKISVTEYHIESSWAGVRPLIFEDGKDPSDISRKDEIWEGESGLITIAGGKLTGYRKMAETVVDLVVSRLKATGVTAASCQTKNTPISGGKFGSPQKFLSYVEEKAKTASTFGLTEQEGYELARKYGTNVPIVLRYARDYEDHKLVGLSPLVYAQLMYAIEYEMTMSPTDFFIRRTGALYFNIEWVRKWKEPVILHMKKVFGWSEAKTYHYTLELERELAAVE